MPQAADELRAGEMRRLKEREHQAAEALILAGRDRDASEQKHQHEVHDLKDELTQSQRDMVGR